MRIVQWGLQAGLSLLLALALGACAGGSVRDGSSAGASTSQQSESQIPQWFRAYLQQQIGRWIADNADYRSATEPFEYYASEWRWGIDRGSVVGELYGLRRGEGDTKLWEYRVYWHTGEQRARVDQWGRQGVMQYGTVVPAGTDNGQLVYELEQVWASPKGTMARSRQRTMYGPLLQQSQSYRWRNGRWSSWRSYEWQRVDVPPPVEKAPAPKPSIAT